MLHVNDTFCPVMVGDSLDYMKIVAVARVAVGSYRFFASARPKTGKSIRLEGFRFLCAA
jgi:hypothetical protein